MEIKDEWRARLADAIHASARASGAWTGGPDDHYTYADDDEALSSPIITPDDEMIIDGNIRLSELLTAIAPLIHNAAIEAAQEVVWDDGAYVASLDALKQPEHEPGQEEDNAMS